MIDKENLFLFNYFTNILNDKITNVFFEKKLKTIFW